MQQKIVFLDMETIGTDVHSECLQQLNAHFIGYAHTKPEEVLARIQDAHIVITNKVVLTQDILKKTPKLQLICIAATGMNVVDLNAAKAQKISVTNVVQYSTDSVAQHTWSLILSLTNALPQYSQAVQQGEWSKQTSFCLNHYPVRELKGKSLGIIGYGAIGQKVAQIGQAFGMNILIANRRYQPLQNNRTTFTEIIKNADVLSVHCPLTKETTDLISTPELFKMKKTALLINTSRGGIINEKALAQAIQKKIIAGAAIDTLTTEPPPKNHPLLTLQQPNLLVTPHCAWASEEARQRLIQRLCEQIQAFQQSKT